MKESNEITEIIAALRKKEVDLQFDNDQLRKLNLALRIAEEKSAVLNSIIESSDDAIVSTNLEGIITSWNNSAERIFGYRAEDIIGQSVFKLIPTDRHHEEPEILEELKESKRVDHFETQRVRKDGSLVDVSLTISPIFDSTGKIMGLSKIARDITQQRNAEVMGERLSAIIASSDDAIISKDLNSIITSWNDGAVRIFGFTAAEMIGQSILKIIPHDRLEEEPKILSQLKKGLRVDHFETIRRRKDGSYIHVSLTISPIKDKRGNVIGLSKIARDISERKEMEKKKDEFIGFVSHELKTPLTSLRSYVQISLYKAIQQKHEFISHALSKAELQTKKMEKMIADFLNVSRLEEGKMKLNPSNFNLVELINASIADSSIISTKHQLHYVGETEALVTGDAEKISLVLANLISNAQKYSPMGGEITISCKNTGQHFLTCVKDVGIGISLENQKSLFQKFSRVESDQTQSISGFGIGLYLVASIMSLHGSQVSVESQPGNGSSFKFELPIADIKIPVI